MKVREETGFLSRGYPFVNATLYVYCDICGSFNVKSYISLRKWLLVFSAVGLIGWAAMEMVRPGGPLHWFLASVVVCGIVFKLFWGDKDYKCRKCGCVTTAQSIPNKGIK